MVFMYIVFGLGNPEPPYGGTRHNAGFFVLDHLAKTCGAGAFASQKKLQTQLTKTPAVLFGKPETFMNLSGQSVRATLDYFHKDMVAAADFSKLYVIHDDLDLPLGKYKIQFGTGPKGHNGLLSIYQHLGTQGFWHVRVGVDTRQTDRSISPAEYVLMPFSSAEKEKLSIVSLEIVTALQAILRNV